MNTENLSWEWKSFIDLHRDDLYEKLKFIQEIFWRTYWRGWLELHPKVFDEYEKKISKYEILNKTRNLRF